MFSENSHPHEILPPPCTFLCVHRLFMTKVSQVFCFLEIYPDHNLSFLISSLNLFFYALPLKQTSQFVTALFRCICSAILCEQQLCIIYHYNLISTAYHSKYSIKVWKSSHKTDSRGLPSQKALVCIPVL